jgi:hypothetical protein
MGGWDGSQAVHGKRAMEGRDFIVAVPFIINGRTVRKWAACSLGDHLVLLLHQIIGIGVLVLDRLNEALFKQEKSVSTSAHKSGLASLRHTQRHTRHGTNDKRTHKYTCMCAHTRTGIETGTDELTTTSHRSCISSCLVIPVKNQDSRITHIPSLKRMGWFYTVDMEE